jgi:hypothetical protein
MFSRRPMIGELGRTDGVLVAESVGLGQVKAYKCSFDNASTGCKCMSTSLMFISTSSQFFVQVPAQFLSLRLKLTASSEDITLLDE